MEKPRIHYELWRDCMSKVMGLRPSPLMSLDYLYRMIMFHDAKVVQAGGDPFDDMASVLHKGVHSYVQAGCQAFSLGPNLVSMFQETDLGNVKAEDLMLPYEAFYLALPEGTMKIWGGKRTGYHDVWGLYVFRTGSPSGGDALAVFSYGGPNEYSVSGDDDACSYVTLSMNQIRKDGNVQRSLELMLSGKSLSTDPTLFEDDNFRLHDHPNPAQLQHEREQRERYKLKAEIMGTGSYIKDGMPGPSRSQVRVEAEENSVLMMRIAVNAMLYLNSPNAEIIEDLESFAEMRAAMLLSKREAEESKPSKIKKISTKISKKRTTLLRYVAPTLEEDMGESCKRRRHWVRGHWNFYWCGKGRTRREARWIMPRLRGEGDEPEGTRHYEMEGE